MQKLVSYEYLLAFFVVVSFGFLVGMYVGSTLEHPSGYSTLEENVTVDTSVSNETVPSIDNETVEPSVDNSTIPEVIPDTNVSVNETIKLPEVNLTVTSCGNGVCETGESCEWSASLNKNILCDASNKALPLGASCNACMLSTVLPVASARSAIVLGAEYGSLGQEVPLGLTKISGVKISPSAYTRWDQIQPCVNGVPQAPNFANLDKVIKKYQSQGMKNIVIGLDPKSTCASQNVGTTSNPRYLPKAQYAQTYQSLVKTLVERYDKDGNADMPKNFDGSLLYPVKYYEVGIEFSSYLPDPASEYVTFLQTTYTTIHQAYPSAVVLHSPFLTTKAFELNPSSSEYSSAFSRVPDKTHSLSDMRAVLDHPESFDMLNVHSLGDPYEIESMVSWLNWEASQRSSKYTKQKQIMISDTGVTPFIAWGPATQCTGTVGAVVDPAQTSDRCRAAAYFSKLQSNDASTVAWVHGFVASDLVKRAVIAADQNIVQINLAFTNDFPSIAAGSGNNAWAGMMELSSYADAKNCAPFFKCRASLWSLKQLQSKIGSYNQLSRIDVGDPNARVYLFMKGNTPVWVAWYENPKQLLLPGDELPSVTIPLSVVTSKVNIEKVITKDGVNPAVEVQLLDAPKGIAQVTLTNTPVYIMQSS